MPHRLPIVGPVLLLACAFAAPAALADWPSFVGDGDRTPPKQGVELVDDLNEAVLLWELDHHMGVGKGLYPGGLKAARARGIEPFYGGTASPIVAGGKVFVTTFKPNGEVPARREGWRTMGEENLGLLPGWFFSVTADDVLVAVDTKTGELAWEAIEKNKGLNRLGHKRNHWGVSPAYADGRVFSMGTAGWLYAYDAATGEKAWGTLAFPSQQQQLAEYKENRKLPWTHNEKMSLVTAAGKVIVPHGGNLTAFDQQTGEKAWTLAPKRGSLISKRATPVPWTHDGEDYLLTTDGTGTVRLIDAATGEATWELGGLGRQLGTINVTGDLAILNAGSKKSEDEKANGLFAAYRISPEGAERVWSLPDDERYRHSWTMDRGTERRAAIQDGRVYFVVGVKHEDRLVTVDAETGKILDEQSDRTLQSPYPIEDRLLVYDDRAHADPVTASWWSIENPDKPRRLHGPVGFGTRSITGYEVPIEWPYVDGVLYGRTMRGLAAWDLRKPAGDADSRTLHMEIPGDVLGHTNPLRANLNLRDGKLAGGGVAGARRQGAIDTSRAQWDGRRVTGDLLIDITGYGEPAAFDIAAAADDDGWLTGTIKSRFRGFDEPVPVKGPVVAMVHQGWMPRADHVLRLPEAAFQAGGAAGRLLLFIRLNDGKLAGVAGFADHTTKASPIVDDRGLTLEDGRLKGVVRVCYRPDEWTTPLVEQGTHAAAVYEIDAKLGGRDGETLGAFEGRYGVDWDLERSVRKPKP